jgi:transcriptional regulator with XRE-family HTH domain
MDKVDTITGNKLKDLKRGYHVGQQIRDIRNKQKRTMLDVATQLGINYQQLQKIELTGNATVQSLTLIANELEHAIIIYPTIIKFKDEKKINVPTK